jgi:peptidoglycan hydrolase-like protein with peptidoglycan-binding domain
MKYIHDWKTFKKINEAEILDTTSPAETATTDASKISVPTPVTTEGTNGVVTSTIVLSDISKKTLESIKKDNNLPYISITTPKEEKYKSFVSIIQEILKFKGSDIKPDGDFGVKTKDATIKFQTDNNLAKKDGIVGEETWTALLKICGLEIKPKMVNTKIVASPIPKKPSVSTETPPKEASKAATNTTLPPKSATTLPFKDYDGELDENFTNTLEFFKSNSAMQNQSYKFLKLLKNNNNINSIQFLNKIYFKLRNESLVDLLIKIMKLEGDTDNWLKNKDNKFMFDLIMNSLIDKNADANMINYAISGVGTYDYLLELLFNKRANLPQTYKKSIEDVYKQKYGETLKSALEGEFQSMDEETIKLIKLMIPNYELTYTTDNKSNPSSKVGGGV